MLTTASLTCVKVVAGRSSLSWLTREERASFWSMNPWTTAWSPGNASIWELKDCNVESKLSRMFAKADATEGEAVTSPVDVEI